jgi:hypothetical protein
MKRVSSTLNSPSLFPREYTWLDPAERERLVINVLVVLQGKAGAVTARTRKRRNDGTASISNDSEISASVSASIYRLVSLCLSRPMNTHIKEEDLFE